MNNIEDKIHIHTDLLPGKTPELVVVFSHPNKDDLRTRSFGTAGYAAEEITEALKLAGIDPARVHYTAAVRHGVGSKKPTAEDFEYWKKALAQDLQAWKPKLIMPMGAEAFKAVMQANMKMGDYVGEIIDSPHGKLMANYSPALIVVADPTKRPEFQDVFKLARRYIDGNLTYDKYQYVVIDDPQENREIVEHYIKQGKLTIGYDAEWYGNKYNDDEVMYEFQYSCEKGIAIVLNISKDGVTENRELLDSMKAILEHPEAKRLGWNIRADDIRLKHRGFNIPDETLAFDGMKAVAFFDSRLTKGLETGIKMFTDYEPYYTSLNRKLKEHKLEKKELAKLKFLEPDIYYGYCAGDAVVHREACLRMMENFPEAGRDYYYNVYLPLTSYFTDMEMTGIAVDLECLERITQKYVAKYDELRAELIKFLKDTYGLEDFNPNSAPQKKELLYGILEVPPAYYTKAGKSPKPASWYNKQKEDTKRLYQPSTNGKSLSTIKFQLEEHLKENPDDNEAYNKYKAITLLLNTSRIGVFATKFLSKKGVQIDAEAEFDEDIDEPLKQSYWAAISKDGNIHASFFECLKNFRSSSSPNVQNPASKVLAYVPDIFVPGYSDMTKAMQDAKKHLIPDNIRNIFYSGHPDYYWGELDVAGADLAIMAFVSGDEDFIHDIRAGNFHQTKMREYFDDPKLSKKDVSKYVISKGITFRVSYTSNLKFASVPIQADIYAENGLYVPLKTIDYALSTWERYKAYMLYRQRCIYEVEEYRQITNARGMTLSYEKTDNFGILAGWFNESLAFPIASELACFMWEASMNLKRLLEKEGLWMKYVYPVNTVHDAGYWTIHKDLIKDNYIQEVLKHVFCHQTTLVTGDNVGCEMVIADRWKGKNKIFENETKWNNKTQSWEWKD
jgi:uracil-DNA glycosylase